MAWYARKCEFSRLNLNIHIHFHFCFHFQFHCEDERFFTFNFNFTVKTNTLNLSLSISLWGRTHFCFQFLFTVKMNTLLLSLSISLWRYDLFVSTNDYTWGCNLLLKIKTKQENWKTNKKKWGIHFGIWQIVLWYEFWHVVPSDLIFSITLPAVME